MSHPDFVQAIAYPIDVAEAVRQYRANEVQLRRLEGTEVRKSRNFTATLAAIGRREAARRRFELALLLAGHKELVGLLTEEAKLNTRIAQAQRVLRLVDPSIADEVRPELKLRLATARRAITRIVQTAKKGS